MANVKALLERSRTSSDGEAYAPVARGRGLRLGMGARARTQGDPVLFIEVVLDPFPDRPRVDPERMRDEGERVASLIARGYSVACDADGTITCERIVAADGIRQELRAIERLLHPTAEP